ncbi:hypothetical protein Tco_0408037 [Tanacetum coccineum]
MDVVLYNVYEEATGRKEMNGHKQILWIVSDKRKEGAQSTVRTIVLLPKELLNGPVCPFRPRSKLVRCLKWCDEDLSKSSKVLEGWISSLWNMDRYLYAPSCISQERPLLDITKKGKKITVYNDCASIMCGVMFKEIISQGEALEDCFFMEIVCEYQIGEDFVV